MVSSHNKSLYKCPITLTLTLIVSCVRKLFLVLSRTAVVVSTCFIVRPPDILIGGLTVYQGFFFLSSSFLFRPLIPEFAERN